MAKKVVLCPICNGGGTTVLDTTRTCDCCGGSGIYKSSFEIPSARQFFFENLLIGMMCLTLWLGINYTAFVYYPSQWHYYAVGGLLVALGTGKLLQGPLRRLVTMLGKIIRKTAFALPVATIFWILDKNLIMYL